MSGVTRSQPADYNPPPAVPAPATAQRGNSTGGTPENTRSNNAASGQGLTAPPAPLRKKTSFIATQLRKKLSQATLGHGDSTAAGENAATSLKPPGGLRKALSSRSLNLFRSLKRGANKQETSSAGDIGTASLAASTSSQAAAAATKEAEDALATAALLDCLDRLKQSGELDETTCHTTTKVVSKALCGIELEQCPGGSLETLDNEFKQHHGPDQKTVYRIDLREAGHSLAVARCGDKAVVLQSWGDNYSIKDWLEGTKTGLAENPLLPKHGPVDIAEIADWLTSMSDHLKGGDVDAAHKQAKAMFNPLGRNAHNLYLGLSFAKPQTGLTTKWSSAAMLNDDALDATH